MGFLLSTPFQISRKYPPRCVADITKRRYIMLRTIKYPEQQKRRLTMKHPVKLTALLYLKEALLKQRYELCPEIIAVAKEFGAASFEIQDLLEDQRRSPG